MNVNTTEKTHSSDGSLTISEINRREQAFHDAQETTVRCGLCPEWSYTGPAAEARAIAAEHRRAQHARTQSRTAAPAVRAAPDRTPAPTNGTHASRAEALVAAAQNLDECEQLLEQARTQLRDAVEAMAA